MANGDDADAEFVSDLLVAHSLADQLYHLTFTVGQSGYLYLFVFIAPGHWQTPSNSGRSPGFEVLSARGFRRGVRSRLPEVVENLRHQLAVKPDLSGKNFPNGVHQSFRALYLAHDSHCAVADRRVMSLDVTHASQNQHACFRRRGLHLGQAVNTVVIAELDVEQRH